MPIVWASGSTPWSTGLSSPTATASGLASAYASATNGTNSMQWVALSGSAAQWAAMANQTSCTQTGTSYWSNTTIWEDELTPTQYYQAAQGRAVFCRQRTAEEQRQFAEQQAAAQRAVAERNALYEQARTRSRELLLAHLTKAQRKTFADKKWFIVIGGQSKVNYRIRDAGHAGNVDVLSFDGERVMHRLCCHCSHSIPAYDNMLAQKLTLEYDEDSFLRLANRHAA